MATRMTFTDDEQDQDDESREVARRDGKLTPGQQRARDARIVELDAKGWSRREIAAELDMAVSSVQKAIHRAYAMILEPAVSTSRRRADLEMQLIRRELWKLALKPCYAYSTKGDIIINPDTGDPMIDIQPTTAVLRELRELNAEYRKLWGTDAPRRSVTAQIPESEMIRELEELRKHTGVSDAMNDPRILQLLQGDVVDDGD